MSQIRSALTGVADLSSTVSLEYFGIKADFEGYGSNTRSFSIPVGTKICPLGCSGNVQANLFTYQFGPQVGLRKGKVQPYTHVLMGGAHSNLGANLYKLVGYTARPSYDALALSFGGGVDILVNHSGTIAFRPGEFDYLWTNFNIASHQSGQSNLQYKVGMVFKF